MSCPSNSQPASAACHRQRGTQETGCGCCHADGVSSAGLWRMPAGNDPLEQTAVLRVQATQVRAAAWHPQNSDSAVTVEERSVVQWRFEGASAEVWRGSTSVIQHAWRLQRSDSTASMEERRVRQCCFQTIHTMGASARGRSIAVHPCAVLHGPCSTKAHNIAGRGLSCQALCWAALAILGHCAFRAI